MLLKPDDKSNISENVNTHSNRDSELNASPKKLEADRAISVPKPPKEEERIKLTSNAQPSLTTPQEGETKKGGCCG